MKASSRRLNLLFLLLGYFSVALAADYSVKGLVTDSVGNPESYATIRIFNVNDTVKPAVGGVAGEDGLFQLNLKEPGEYRVNILSFGKSDFNKEISLTPADPACDMGTIVLGNAAEQLEEVVVTAQRPLISKEIDRIGYDVQADNEAQTSQLDQILRKVPLVSVDPDGTIKVKGSTNFKIYRNGRPNNSFSRNAKDIFKAIPASMIKKIEVITDPGSREDAEGTSAILNIVTMENTVIKGVMGNVGLRYSKNGDFPTPNIWLNSQIDKFNLSLYGGMSNMSRKANHSESESYRKYEESDNEMLTTSQSDSHGNIMYGGIDMSFEPDTLNLFTAEFGGYWYNFDSESISKTLMRHADGTPIYSYTSLSTSSPNRYGDLNGSFNYQRSTRKKGENITLSYLISTTDQTQHSTSHYEDEVNLPVPYTGTSNDFNLKFLEQTAQLDWTRPISEIHKFDVGAKYINRRNHSINNQEYFDYETTYSNFQHITQVLALYFDYRLKYKKLGARAGLRYEYSHLGAKYRDGSAEPFSSSLNDFVPNVSVSYDINDANTLKFGYSTRINRPGISQLNPAVISSPTSISSGNPDLKSSLMHSLNLSYSLILQKVNINWNTGYSFSNNQVIRVQDLLPGDITKYWYANSGKNRNFYTNLWTMVNFTQKTRLMLSLNLYNDYSRNKSADIKEGGWGYSIYTGIRQTLPFDIDLSVSGDYWRNSPSLYTYVVQSFKNNFYYYIDLSKSFLKEKRLSVRASIVRPFMKSPTVYESMPRNTGYTGYDRSYNFNSTNNFSFSISYRFGNLNASVKKTARSISNDDLQGRKN